MHACFSMLIAGCAALALPAVAQPVTPQGSAAATPTPKAAVPSPKAVAVVTSAARTPGATRVTAAGSVIILADGIVANATIAQIQPPAPDFVYER